MKETDVRERAVLARPLRLSFFSGERPWEVTGGQMVPQGASAEIRDAMLRVQR